MDERLHFEDIPEGGTFATPARTITAEDVDAFAALSGDRNPLHVDEGFARADGGYDGRVAHALLVTAVGAGLHGDWSTLAYVECSRRFRRPVFPGDAVRFEYDVVGRRALPDRPAGIVRLDVRMRNQDGEIVQTGRDVLLVRRRDARGS